MRDDHDRFTAAGASIVAIAPEDEAAVARYIGRNPVPYAILSDDDHTVFDAYDVASRALSLGQRPALFVIDRDGIVRHVFNSQLQATKHVDEALGVIKRL